MRESWLPTVLFVKLCCEDGGGEVCVNVEELLVRVEVEVVVVFVVVPVVKLDRVLEPTSPVPVPLPPGSQECAPFWVMHWSSGANFLSGSSLR